MSLKEVFPSHCQQVLVHRSLFVEVFCLILQGLYPTM